MTEAQKLAQAQFEQRVFRHYMGDHAPVGDWEVLVYAMLLDHAPELISDDPAVSTGKRGRPKVFTSEWASELEAEIAKVSEAPDAPPRQRTRTGALIHLFKSSDFAARFKVAPEGRNHEKLAKVVLNRLGEARQKTMTEL